MFREGKVSGEQVVVDLSEIPSIEAGALDNVQSARKLRPFIRDDLLEPEDSKMTLRVFRNDIQLSSCALRPGSRNRRTPELCEWEGSTESYHEAAAAGFPEELVRGMWRGSPLEKGPRSGSRKAIKHFTRVSRNRLKFTLRNALTGCRSVR